MTLNEKKQLLDKVTEDADFVVVNGNIVAPVMRVGNTFHCMYKGTRHKVDITEVTVERY